MTTIRSLPMRIVTLLLASASAWLRRGVRARVRTEGPAKMPHSISMDTFRGLRRGPSRASPGRQRHQATRGVVVGPDDLAVVVNGEQVGVRCAWKIQRGVHSVVEQEAVHDAVLVFVGPDDLAEVVDVSREREGLDRSRHFKGHSAAVGEEQETVRAKVLVSIPADDDSVVVDAIQKRPRGARIVVRRVLPVAQDKAVTDAVGLAVEAD